ncbi:GAF domain-containing sensor histidine kinase [Deferribacterales bacterium Es71-Z0220]|uniref:GAF domain-containing sensor histidine kinase n=1 Tax=Deferrivibrio essentukiensis TaxID=2880922 RepID=UPI001F60F51A|nr:GAF domain-containing sensor histidine kinase [Deferrivibrio essentukiensis]MCB4203902.1 GAF domain-containing sensor histidine kinase [Deferrivibrio essentukiensis]
MKKDIFDILVEISEIMNTIFETDELIPQILNITEKFLNVKRVSLMLIDDNKLKIIAATNLPVNFKEIEIPIGEGISGRVAMSGKPVIVNNESSCEDELGYKAKSYLSFPLKVRDKVIGVLNLTDKENDFFNNTDVKIAGYIASQCALAINRFSLYEEKKKTEHLKVIGKFTSSIAHDIKNLLQIVQSYIELMEIEMEGESEIKLYIDSICTEVKLIHGLTLDILDFANKQINLRKSRVRLSDFLNEIKKHADILTNLTPIKFEVTFEEDIEFECDKEKLFRVFFNLINNSIEAVGENGNIGLDVKKKDGDLIFELIDDGKGIKKENIDKIFDPFFTSGKMKGTGLGLAVVKEIVQAHKGVITVESEENKYTKFTVRIPIV